MFIVTNNVLLLSGEGYISPHHALSRPSSVLLWTGERFSEFVVTCRGASTGLYNVLMDNGMKLVCHGTSLWHTKRGPIQTSSLKNDDTIVQATFPRLDVYGNHGITVNDVPLNQPSKHKIAWLKDLFASSCSGIIEKDGNTLLAAYILSYNMFFVRTLQLLLTSLNIYSSIDLSDTEPCCLLVDTANVAQLSKLGIHTRGGQPPAHAHEGAKDIVLGVSHVMPIGIDSVLYSIEPKCKNNCERIVCNGVYL